MNQILAYIVLLSASFVGIHAVRCYDCAYVNLDQDLYEIPAGTTITEDAGCKDPFNATTSGARISECDGTCLKSETEKDGTPLTVARTCLPRNSLVDCRGSTCQSAFGINSCVHCCTTDLCNGAGSVAFNLMTTTAMLVLTLLLSRASQ